MGWEPVSEQQLLGPAERVKAWAVQVAAYEIRAQQRAIKSRNAGQRADHGRGVPWQTLAEQDHDGKAEAAK
jgi:hypothetical protein